MLPQTIPLTELKKDYKFLWSIDGSSSTNISGMGTSKYNEQWYELSMMQKFTLQNPIYCAYISQLAQEVRLPDDEFEIEQISNGPVTYEIPKKIKLANIQVTYLEDSINSVYNFHKTWYNMIRGGTGVYFNQPTKLCASARYIEYEDTVTGMTYVINSELEGTSKKLVNTIKFVAETMKPELPINAKRTGITLYPRIYPTRISRTSANKGGQNLHKVTVTYARIPTFRKNHNNIQYFDETTHNWTNTKPETI